MIESLCYFSCLKTVKTYSHECLVQTRGRTFKTIRYERSVQQEDGRLCHLGRTVYCLIVVVLLMPHRKVRLEHTMSAIIQFVIAALQRFCLLTVLCYRTSSSLLTCTKPSLGCHCSRSSFESYASSYSSSAHPYSSGVPNGVSLMK